MNLSTQHGRDARPHGQFLQKTQPDDEEPQWRSVEVTGSGGVPSFAAAHQYGAARHAALVYDEDGNLIENDHWLFGWDAENRLTGPDTPPAAVLAGVPEQKLEFADDAAGRRIQKKVSLKSGGVRNVKDDVRFVFDGWNLVAEAAYLQNAGDAPWTGGNAAYLRRTYMWGPDVSGTWDGAGGVGGLLALTRHARGTQPAESYWATADLNGNVIGLLSTSGTKTAVYDYDAFGKVARVSEPEAGLNPVRFSSKYQDVETGMNYYGYRYYSSEMGRWISRDPIGEAGGINLYGMVGNDPVNYWDYLGEKKGDEKSPNLDYVDVVSKKQGSGYCGDAVWSINWTLLNGGEGVIAQQVTFSGWLQVCGKRAKQIKETFKKHVAAQLLARQDLFGSNGVYTEYWNVSGGKIQYGGDDNFLFKGQRGLCTKGDVTIGGEAKFVKGATLPNDAKPGDHPFALRLNSVPRHVWPSGQAESNTVKRKLRIKWDCCNNTASKTKVD